MIQKAGLIAKLQGINNYVCIELYVRTIISVYACAPTLDTTEEQNQEDNMPSLPPLPPDQLNLAVQVLFMFPFLMCKQPQGVFHYSLQMLPQLLLIFHSCVTIQYKGRLALPNRCEQACEQLV